MTPDAARTRTATSLAKQGLMAHLGARLGDVSPGEVHIHLPTSPHVTQQHGFFKINLLAPAIGDELEAIGTVLSSGRTLTVCRMDVFARAGGERKLVAAGQQTVIAVRI